MYVFKCYFAGFASVINISSTIGSDVNLTCPFSTVDRWVGPPHASPYVVGYPNLIIRNWNALDNILQILNSSAENGGIYRCFQGFEYQEFKLHLQCKYYLFIYHYNNSVFKKHAWSSFNHFILYVPHLVIETIWQSSVNHFQFSWQISYRVFKFSKPNLAVNSIFP